MNPWSGAVQRRSFRQGGALPFQCASDFSHVAQICLRPCMQPLVTSFRNTTSSQDTFHHLLGLSLPMCQMALQRCPSQVLTCKLRTRRVSISVLSSSISADVKSRMVGGDLSC